MRNIFAVLNYSSINVIKHNSGAARSWYGKMFQPPPDAIVDPASKLTYKDYRKLQIKAIKDPLSLEEGSFLPLACGPAIRIDSSAGSSVPWGAASMGANDEGGCTGDEIYCWMRCMSTAGTVKK